MDNLEEMDKFLETYSLPRLSQEETDNLNRLITGNEIENSNKKLPANKSPGLNGFTGEFHQTYKKELLSILLMLFQKTGEEGTLPNSFYKPSLPRYKSQTRHSNKKKYRPIYLINIDTQILNKILLNWIQQHIKKSYTTINLDLFQGHKDGSPYANQSMWYTILTNWRIKTM